MIKVSFNQVLVILLVICIALISWFFLSGTFKFYNECDEASEIYQLTFQGTIVEKKDADPHSRNIHLEIMTTSNQEEVLILLHDENINIQSGKSLIWELIDVGDSIMKESNSFEINYKKPEKKWQRRILGFELCK